MLPEQSRDPQSSLNHQRSPDRQYSSVVQNLNSSNKLDNRNFLYMTFQFDFNVEYFEALKCRTTLQNQNKYLNRVTINMWQRGPLSQTCLGQYVVSFLKDRSFGPAMEHCPAMRSQLLALLLGILARVSIGCCSHAHQRLVLSPITSVVLCPVVSSTSCALVYMLAVFNHDIVQAACSQYCIRYLIRAEIDCCQKHPEPVCQNAKGIVDDAP